MRYTVRLGCIALLSVFVISIINSCSSNSSESYSIQGSTTPTEAGSVTPATGEYDEGANVEIRAEANSSWVFSSWEGDITGTENPVVVTVEDDMVFTALFDKLQYPLEVNVDGSGTVEENIIQSKKTDYDVGTEVELNAVEDEGWVFVEWQGDLTGSENPQTLTMDEEKSVTAVFEKEGHELTVNVTGEGNVKEELLDDASKNSYPVDSVVELTAEPADGWTFVGWEGDLSGDDNPAEITMDDNKEVTAVFERRDYALSINTDGEGSVNEEVVSEPNKDYTFETVVELTASPADGWNFVRWEGDLEGSDNPQEITIDEEKTVTAVFERNTYELTVETTGQGSVNEEKVGQAKTAYGYNSIVELTAESDEGWEFDEWQGDLSGDDNPKEITIDEDKNVTAVFVEAQYELNLSTEGGGDGTIDVDPQNDFYNYGDEIEITAIPDETSEFKEWSGDISSSENPKTITVTSDLDIIAIFGGRPEVETADWSDMRVNSVTGGGEVTGDGGFDVTDRGVCWSQDENPNLSDSCTNDGSGTGSFESDITGLSQAFTYYVRAYATNQAGTSYGDQIELQAGYVSHGYINGLTPSKDSKFENRSYKLVKSEWKGGVDKIWIEKNLGASTAVKSATDDNPNGAGWYFQFNREQGYFHNGDVRIPNGSWDGAFAENTDWEIKNDPCRAAFGGEWRVPTAAEWQSFYIAGEAEGGMENGDYSSAFSSLLRLHAAGAINTKGSLTQRGSIGFYWSSDQVDSESSSYFGITSSASGTTDITKAGGLTVRCVKN